MKMVRKINCDETRSFQFRKEKYEYSDVIDDTLEEIADPYCRDKYDEYISKHPVSEPPEKKVRMFGESLLREYESLVERRNKNAVREVINCGLNRVIKGGSNKHIDFLPQDPSEIDRQDVCKFLNVVRGTRIRNVRRSWSRR